MWDQKVEGERERNEEGGTRGGDENENDLRNGKWKAGKEERREEEGGTRRGKIDLNWR